MYERRRRRRMKWEREYGQKCKGGAENPATTAYRGRLWAVIFIAQFPFLCCRTVNIKGDSYGVWLYKVTSLFAFWTSHDVWEKQNASHLYNCVIAARPTTQITIGWSVRRSSLQKRRTKNATHTHSQLVIESETNAVRFPIIFCPLCSSTEAFAINLGRYVCVNRKFGCLCVFAYLTLIFKRF